MGENISICSGTIIKAEEFLRAQKPAYKAWVDFGNELGIKKTLARITVNYSLEKLLGKTVIGAVNLPPKNIAGFISEFLLLGVTDYKGNISLLRLTKKFLMDRRFVSFSVSLYIIPNY